jgi:hypothetical protein
LRVGRAPWTHDYTRNVTTTLLAALDVLTGTVIGQWLARHRRTEFIKFVRTIDREAPDGPQIHLILDNDSTDKHAEVDRWLKRHSRFHLHFTPTSVVAQSGPALVSRPDRQESAPRGVRQRARSDRQHRGIPQRPQRRSQTLRVDSHRRIHPRQSPARTHQTPTSS